jgi:glycogen operon protein
MLHAGDELWHTKQGNNNTYCQDNELSWHVWTPRPERDEMSRFTRELVLFRRRHPGLRRPAFVDPFAIDGSGVVGQIGTSITWHGVELHKPDWSFHSHSLALHVHAEPPAIAPDSADDDIYIIFNAWSETLDFDLPELEQGKRWYRIVDSALEAPHDIADDEAKAAAITSKHYAASPRSSVILLGR